MDRDIAFRLAKAYVDAESAKAGVELAILEDRTLDRPFGWVFFYDTGEFTRTGDDLARAVGNAPLIVDKESGKLHVTGTARPIEYYLSLYERFGHCRPEG
jgi:Immunity protein 35